TIVCKGRDSGGGRLTWHESPGGGAVRARICASRAPAGLFARLQVPQLDRLVTTSRNQPFAVAAERQAQDATDVPTQGDDFLACPQAPPWEGGSPARGRRALAVATQAVRHLAAGVRRPSG